MWSIRGLESTGEDIGKLSLSECSELIDWLRNCEAQGGKPINQSSLIKAGQYGRSWEHTWPKLQKRKGKEKNGR